MGDLEEKISKTNIPGKYTWWDKDSDEEGAGARCDWVDREASDPEAEMTELQKQRKWVENDCPEPIKNTIIARNEKERARTGVKGVLADYQAWKRSADAEDLVNMEYRAAMLSRLAEGYRLPSDPVVAGAKHGPRSASDHSNDEGDDDDDDDDDDNGIDEFLGEYRQRRLQQLKANAGRPHFGQIIEADRTTFVKAVDMEDPRTHIVVHLYEPYITACRRMNRFLEVLAGRQTYVKFMRLRSTAAEGGAFDPVALPTLLIYRAGEVVRCFTRVTDEVGDNFTQEDVEWLLQEHDVFESTELKAAATVGQEEQDTRHRAEDSDDFGDDGGDGNEDI